MHRDEENLETAGEEPEHQQQVAAVTERLRERLHHRLLHRRSCRRRARTSRRRQGERERDDEQRERREYDQRALPAVGVDERHRERRKQELSE
jgi:hypothetical protein